MMRGGFFLPLLLTVSPLAAQVTPMPDPDNPTRQSIRYVPGEQIVLTALPGVPLTLSFDPADPVLQVDDGDTQGWTVDVVPSRDGVILNPTQDSQPGSLVVRTQKRLYAFDIRTAETLTSAVLVRFEYDDFPIKGKAPRWGYRLRGDREVRPASITDDGTKTWITYAPGQPLPAVFAIGPTGEEQVVNGYMRGDAFEIDRVWEELVFRIDREKATAQRNREPDKGS